MNYNRFHGIISKKFVFSTAAERGATLHTNIISFCLEKLKNQKSWTFMIGTRGFLDIACIHFCILIFYRGSIHVIVIQ